MIKIRIILALTVLPFLACAQNNEQEKQEIKTAVLGYIENFFLNDYNNMEKHLHDRLAKRGVNQDGTLSEEYPKPALKALMNNKQALPLNLQSNKVDSIFIDRNFASAILSTGYPGLKWKEYIHLAKLEGEWLIMDVFWNFEE